MDTMTALETPVDFSPILQVLDHTNMLIGSAVFCLAVLCGLCIVWLFKFW